ncbi:hypothetical protein ACFQ60_00615 [Streptomyces zhihengii]|uniref:hypothetical protein n=1 Tax=Streptomyces zhihengii TaxID=1818004 RepID=UPI001FCF8511|nr:hypothetical protein [Streptomyces zhihengii]
MVLVIVVAALALLAGLAANRWLRPRLVNADDDEGMAVKNLVGPLLTMTVLLLSFVLVTANGSCGKAEVASRGRSHGRGRGPAGPQDPADEGQVRPDRRLRRRDGRAVRAGHRHTEEP